MNRRVYNVTVIGEGPVRGTRVRVLLGARQTISPDLALAFLRCQARRIADGLDPDPSSPWAPPGALVPEAFGPDVFGPEAFGPEAFGPDVLVPEAFRPDGCPSGSDDAPAELRSWCADIHTQQKARNRLLAGEAVTLSVADRAERYTLTVLPVCAPAHHPPPPPPRTGRRRHRKPRWLRRRRKPDRIARPVRRGRAHAPR
ncbi:hypothetical protein AB0O07_26130 [Streptomyces sp. NPDC093085]|uniref:hypothetical protein n=1 Tax=Streptomyces sp. NPDC093085 TaxID=3155068 RepID=UPI0034449DB0